MKHSPFCLFPLTAMILTACSSSGSYSNSKNLGKEDNMDHSQLLANNDITDKNKKIHSLQERLAFFQSEFDKLQKTKDELVKKIQASSEGRVLEMQIQSDNQQRYNDLSKKLEELKQEKQSLIDEISAVKLEKRYVRQRVREF